MDPKKYEERFISIVQNGFIGLEIAKGHKLGLYEALRDLGEPVTSHELASRCKLKERYVREWLGCMTAAQLVFISDDDKYFIPDDCKPHTSTSQLASLMPAMAAYSKINMECFRADGPNGYNYAGHPDTFDWLDEGRSEFDFEWIEKTMFPSGFKDKDVIVNVLDFGCGTGALAIKLAEYLPRANIIGIDIEEYAISESNKKKKSRNLSNINFVLGNGKLDQSWKAKFDWIVMYDVLHDLPNPAPIMAELKRVLKDDGIISTSEPYLHSDHKKNVGNFTAAMYYVFSTNACLPCSMSEPPAVGHGIGWGIENRAAYVKSLNFKILNDEDNSVLHMQKEEEV